ncbi:uncharacterized protein J3D65DRAFT_553837 [Phyllosticta citribraziliensis]|uniref:White collar 2 protein n=1 Tax=Phyllosticta citribraziliensis TaxID=989973 RepID=A0ABR1LQU3_9PEZI
MASQGIDGEASSSNVTPTKDTPSDDEVLDFNDEWLSTIRSTIRDMHIILSSGGTINYLSTSCKRLLGYDPEQLIRQKITDYIHEDDLPTFASELFESQTTGSTFRFYCRMRRAQAESGDGAPSPGGPDGGTGGFFSVMARPYPLSQSAELDRFLALKLEELVLNSHITQLRAEESVLQETAPISPSQLSPDGQFMENLPFFVSGMNPLINPQSQQGQSLSPLDRPPDPAFSGPEHHSTLQSPFISPPPNNQQPQPLAGSQGKGYVCVECGTTQAPEWRRGPMGPKTLCNACGCESASPSSYFSSSPPFPRRSRHEPLCV